MATTPAGVSPQLAAMEAAFGDALQRTAARLNAFGTAVGVVMKRIQNAATGTGGTAGTNAANGPNAGASVSGLDEKRLEKFKVALGTIGDAFVSAFSRGQSAVLSAVGAINPMALDTFNGSLTLLSQSLGEIFVPYIEAASRQIQQLSKWFDGLSGDTKTTIARVTLFAMATGGVIMAARTLIPLLQSVRVAALMMNAAMMANPVGAVVALTAAVAALAAAWFTVSSNASGAGAAMGQAGNTPVGAATGGGGDLVLTPEEIDALPDPYRKQFTRLRAGIEAADNYGTLTPHQRVQFRDTYMTEEERSDFAKQGVDKLPETTRLAVRERLLQAGSNYLSQFQQDNAAAVAMLPDEQQKVIEKDPRRRAEIMRAEAAKTREEAQRDFEDAPAKADAAAKGVAARRDVLRRAVTSPEVDKVLQTQLAKYSARKGIDPDTAPRILAGDDAAPEFRAVEDAILDRAKAIDKDSGISRATLATLKITQPDPRRAPERGGLQIDVESAVKQLGTLASLLSLAQTKEARAMMLERAAQNTESRRGATSDDFIRFGKMPVQSRFTDGFGFAESMQLAVLNQSEGDAKLLLRQLQSMEKLMGSMARAIDQYAQKGGGDASSYMRGFIDLWR